MTMQETAKTLYLEAEGIQYAYRIIGNSSDNGPPLLMLNHVRSTIDTWDPWVINNLTATGRQLITCDYTGLGHSNGRIQSSIRGVAWFNRSTTSRAGIAGKDGEPEIALSTTGEALVNLTQAHLTWDADPIPYALLQSIQKDVLVTNGDNDLIVPTKNSYILARQLPRANFVMFPSSGHGHLFQYAGYYTKLVGEFLDGKLPTAPFSSGRAPAFGSYGQYNE
ncbi:hypothetical protein INS49_008060 [Diaporthe citri]|uniref:uncharacterized protein n=1 Tax=Diaporthe citri TaxID=83186 RepID=UPI001C808337|nr:uncharacterized protein INS49_008060 [Diaporthe citri]KAG6362965.1 hypothetical protein INS49_008060 [Diaporthe citri]